MDKGKYLKYLEDKIKLIVKSPYRVRFVDEISYEAEDSDDKYTIICVISFGASTIPVVDRSTVNQPISFMIYSEADGHEVASKVFTSLFISQSYVSYQDSKLNVLQLYSSPVLMSSKNEIGGYNRALLLMNGNLNISEGKSLGQSVKLNGEEQTILSSQITYNTAPVSTQPLGSILASTVIDSANNSFSVSVIKNNSDLHNNIFKMSILGVPKDYRINYTIDDITINCVIISIMCQYEQSSMTTTITLTLMPSEI